MGEISKFDFSNKIKLKNANTEELISQIESQVEKKPGVYTLHIIENNGKPKLINRLINSDKNGILYIGMTEGSLMDRVFNLKNAIEINSKIALEKPKESKHMQVGMKFYRIRKKVDLDSLYVLLHPSKKAKELESIYLEKYVSIHGELPPMNGQYGSCNPDWEWF